MPLFIDHVADMAHPGAAAIEIAAPNVVEGITLGYLGLAFHGEWGPDNVLSTPDNTGEFLRTYFPPGSPHTSKGYYAIMGRSKLALKPFRVLHSDGAAAFRVINLTGGTGSNEVQLNAAAKGVLGNSITTQLVAATNGDTAARDIVWTLTDPVTGTSSERWRNVYPNGNVGSSGGSAINLATINGGGKTYLGAALTFPVTTGSNTAWPAADVSAVALGSGSEGSALTAADYNAAWTAMTSDKKILVIAADEIASGIKAAVFSAVMTHLSTTRNRMAVLQCDLNASLSTLQTEVATVRSDRVIYCGAFAQTFDDAGNLQSTPWATYVASCLVSQDPAESHAIWDSPAADRYSSVQGYVAPFDIGDETSLGVQDTCTEQGICIPKHLEDGRWTSLHDRTTNVANVGLRFAISRRIKDFFARSIVANLSSDVNKVQQDSANVEMKSKVDAFMEGQKNPTQGSLQRCKKYSTDIKSANTDSTAAAGQFFLILNATTPVVNEKILIPFNVGPTVTVLDTPPA